MTVPPIRAGATVIKAEINAVGGYIVEAIQPAYLYAPAGTGGVMANLNAGSHLTDCTGFVFTMRTVSVTADTVANTAPSKVQLTLVDQGGYEGINGGGVSIKARYDDLWNLIFMGNQFAGYPPQAFQYRNYSALKDIWSTEWLIDHVLSDSPRLNVSSIRIPVVPQIRPGHLVRWGAGYREYMQVNEIEWNVNTNDYDFMVIR